MIELEIKIPRLDQIMEDLEQGVSDFVWQIARDIRNETQSNLDKPPHTGRLYKRKGGRIHQASAIGEHPAKDTGNLWGSVSDVRMVGNLSAEFTIGAPYGNVLEFSMHRPFLMPAIDHELEQGLMEI